MIATACKRGAGAALALLLLAGCEDVGIRMGRNDVLGNAAMGYVRDPEIIVATTDWSELQSVNAVCEDYTISPTAFTLRQGQPYRLRLSNPDQYTHYFTAEDFFRSIAVQKLVSSKGEDTFPYYEAISLRPGEGKDLYFVPVEDGIFDAECSAMWNMVLGSTARIAVEKVAGYEAQSLSATLPAGTQASAQEGKALDPSLRAREVLMSSIRMASRAELEAIKADLERMEMLAGQRESELEAAGQ